jgi:hypothetical protein
MLDEEDVACVSAIDFCDPATFAGRLEVHDKLADDLRNESLESVVPAVLLGVAHALAANDVAHIANAMWAQHVAWDGMMISSSCLPSLSTRTL